MHLAFAIVSLFPGGGLQRDCVALARVALSRGHRVTIFAARVRGEIPKDIVVEHLSNSARTNHGRNRRFAADLAVAARGFDRVVGFDKLPGLDVLYCADPCFVARHSGFTAKLTPRYRTFATLERHCFGRGEKTRLILLSAAQRDGYRRAYDTEPARIKVLAPTVDSARHRPELRRDGTRERVRANYGMTAGDWLWLAVGSAPKTKGFDRIVEALPAFPKARLVVVGVDAASGEGAELMRQAARHGCGERVNVIGFHEDVPQLLAGADLLVHPARLDTTGTVILEAIVNGLPVVASAACGYAEHIAAADAGLVVPEPFRPAELHAALTAAADPARAERWSANAMRYGQNPALYRGRDEAADIILSDAMPGAPQ